MIKTLTELQSPAPYYANLLPQLRLAAQSCGYALAVHGTLSRDLDLIAAPWDETCSNDKTLAEAICKAANGFILPTKSLKDGTTGDNPTKKPHGRIAWTIKLDDKYYIDLSVTPKDFSSEEKSVKLLCDNWAEDHTYLQNLCRRLGYSEVEVDGNGYVLTIRQLADMLFAGPQGSVT